MKSRDSRARLRHLHAFRVVVLFLRPVPRHACVGGGQKEIAGASIDLNTAALQQVEELRGVGR
jgi:hypothetical protein